MRCSRAFPRSGSLRTAEWEASIKTELEARIAAMLSRVVFFMEEVMCNWGLKIRLRIP
jgi:hypothetical protein